MATTSEGRFWYQEYRETDYWQTFSEELKKERGSKCEQCGRTPCSHGVILDVHHNGYGNGYLDENGKPLVGRERERPRLMQILCRDCHDRAHGLLPLTE